MYTTLEQLDAALDAVSKDLSPRVEELAQKSAEGALTPEEHREYTEVVRLNDMLSLLELQAEEALDDARSVVKLSSEARELVQRRAQGACEYGRLPQSASILPHQVDPIIGRQHRGSDDAANLCLCCVRCN